MGDLGGVAIQMSVALLTMLALIGGLYWVMHRVAPRLGKALGRKPGSLSVVEHLALGPRRSLVLVRFENEKLLLGVTDHTVNLISRTADHDDQAHLAFDQALARQTACYADKPDTGLDPGDGADHPAGAGKP